MHPCLPLFWNLPFIIAARISQVVSRVFLGVEKSAWGLRGWAFWRQRAGWPRCFSRRKSRQVSIVTSPNSLNNFENCIIEVFGKSNVLVYCKSLMPGKKSITSSNKKVIDNGDEFILGKQQRISPSSGRNPAHNESNKTLGPELRRFLAVVWGLRLSCDSWVS